MSGGGVDLSQILAQRQQPASAQAAGGQVIDVPSIVMDITDETFEQLMQLSQVVPVVVLLGADNCAPCDELEPRLEALTRGLEGRVLLARVNAGENPGLQQAFQVQ